MAWRSWWSQRFDWTQKNLSNRSCETVEVDNFRQKYTYIYIYIIWDVSCFVWLNVLNGSGAFVWTLEFFHLQRCSIYKVDADSIICITRSQTKCIFPKNADVFPIANNVKWHRLILKVIVQIKARMKCQNAEMWNCPQTKDTWLSA